MNEQVETKNPIDKFLDVFASPNTRRNYQAALYDFFHAVYGDPKLADASQRREWAKQKAAEYLSEKRTLEDDINGFVTAMTKLAPKSSRLKLTAVKMFLLDAGIELSPIFWRRVQKHIRGSRALTIDKVPENSDLRKIVSHLPIHGKTLVLMLSSSGMRIGEAMGLKLSNVTAVGDLLRIQIPGGITKSGNSRITFASRETKEALDEWFKVREQYIKSAVGKSHFYHKALENEDRVFPFHQQTAYWIWANALKKTGMTERDQSTNRKLTHLHVLRKFFRTKLGSVISSDVVEALLGHEEGLTAVYRKYSEKDMLRMYAEGEHALLVFGELSGDAQTLRKEMNTVYRENFELRATLEEMKQRITKTEQKFENIEKLIQDLKYSLAVLMENPLALRLEEELRKAAEEKLKKITEA